MNDFLHSLSGSTRLHFIVGDPIAQVKAPLGMSQAFAARGHHAVCVPAHVAPGALAQWFAGTAQAQNVDGIIATVPHKFASYALCASASPTAHFLQAANTLRRNPDGSWHGDMLDGLGMVAAMEAKGCALGGKRALLVGAGGAGSAIAHALVMAGVAHLGVCDADAARQASLVARLGSLGLCAVEPAGNAASGFDLVVNASPLGMLPGDPLPVPAADLAAPQCVACAVTAPALTPLIAAARAAGCTTVTGADMFAQVRDLMLDFLLHKA